MKKYFYLLISLIILSCNTEDDFIEDKKEDIAIDDILLKNSNPVKLTKAWTTYSSYRGYESYVRKFTVKVANLAYDKTVSIYHQKIDGNWDQIPLAYNQSVDNGQNEIWFGEYSLSGYGVNQVYADAFVVRYDVNGTTYWDNNNGSDYKMSRTEGFFFADSNINVSVDTDFVGLSYSAYDDQNRFNITVDVRNLDPNKEVGVVYSSDGWKTQKYLPLIYRQFWSNGPFYTIQSPNNFGIERWQGYTLLSASDDQLEYAIVYRVNGKEYWDNNYGENYMVNVNSNN
ncbi:Carbohydrate/starch-binding module (family 21) [Aquimarina amphilecti]|uniref:Carbohydrate/starch-binding module (Family 21) n=1 Tax=Aquimarina amphilecti TaxID=1038014 RepID=A0A1H7NGK7_AQUAM|nr:carbohydrate-binding protein [Aquimarina amphilecti]SEL22135.1 Carbohydrate/starch-binding module (family 21) [Aquimarina amphilecti]